jgi:hypothetical protein
VDSVATPIPENIGGNSRLSPIPRGTTLQRQMIQFKNPVSPINKMDEIPGMAGMVSSIEPHLESGEEYEEPVLKSPKKANDIITNNKLRDTLGRRRLTLH